jgi:hypothetical protein
MLVTITEFSQLARDSNGNVLPLGEGRIACNVRTTVGAFPALSGDTELVRIATDTAVQMDIRGGATDSSDELFMPGVEFIAVTGGETLTIAAVV